MQYPIDDVMPQIRAAVRSHNALVLHAPPGAGKTTRVPLALLEELKHGRIIMLEPRRLAARSAALWMSASLGESVGSTVGYSIRFDSCISKQTRIEVVTEGILTRRLQGDPGLDGVSAVIFDEFHERNIHSDLSLALCIDMQRHLRPDLKIVVMSATLDCAPVSALLNNAPVISSEGRAFAVEERYLPDKTGAPPAQQVKDAVARALHDDEGDILVFLPGAGEIRTCAERLEAARIREKGLEIHPLYGDLSFEAQERAILPSDSRKIVLATNIAETSLTIEGVRVVIDSGLARRLQFDPASGMDRLLTTNISKASAEQRKGRAGRLAPGVCYRLYSEYDFSTMQPFSSPEIATADLSSLALDLAAWGSSSSELSWLDAPPPAAMSAAAELLRELGATDSSGRITDRGRAMARLPLHPRLSCMVLRSMELGSSQTGADLAALLSERDIFLRPSRTGTEGYGDIHERLEVLGSFRRSKHAPSYTDLRALKNAIRISAQVSGMLLTARTVPDLVDADTVSRLLICAFPDRIAQKRPGTEARFISSAGRGLRFSRLPARPAADYIVALRIDDADKAEGTIHLFADVSEQMLRSEFSSQIKTTRNIVWDNKDRRISAATEESLGAIVLSSRRYNPADAEVAAVICDAIRRDPHLLSPTDEALQLIGRINLAGQIATTKEWPILSWDTLASSPEEWLLPHIGRSRTAEELRKMDLVPAIKALLTWEQQRLLDRHAPTHIGVPSGRRLSLDYTSGDTPVLAVKLQEMFGLADTPTVADGKIRVLIHLLSPAGRPLQITQDLKAFWNSSYQLVKKEMKGRYPKHPWPDDPWNALPTAKTKNRIPKS